MTEVVSQIVSIVIFTLGVSYLILTNQWVKIAQKSISSSVPYPYRLLTALLLIAVGLAIVIYHNLWTPFWRIIITFFGWLFVVKGTTYLVFPQIMKRFADWSEQRLQVFIIKSRNNIDHFRNTSYLSGLDCCFLAC